MKPATAPLFSWRVAAAGLSYVVFGIGASVPAFIALGLKLMPIDQARRQRLTRQAIRGLCRRYLDLMQFMGLFRYRVIDNHRAPVSGQLIIANHPMLIDALFVLACLPNVCCIAKPGLAHNPFTRMTFAQAGYIVSRDEDLIDQVCTRLDAGENVLIFPEGTRNVSDNQLPFRRGAANMAVISGCSILPVVIQCRPRFLQKHEKWYRFPAERSQVTVSIQPALTVSDCIDTSEPRTLQYRTLTRYLRDYYSEKLS